MHRTCHDDVGTGLINRPHFLIIMFFSIVGWFVLFDLNFISDGERYYAYLRSFFFDFDLNFYNEYTFYTFHPTPEKGHILTTTPTGYLWNPFAIGPSLVWLPFFLIGHIWVLVAQSLGYPVLANGYSLPYLLMVSLGTLFYGLAGLYCCYRLLSRYFRASWALISTLLTFWSSPAIAYLYREPGYSYSQNFFFISLFLLLWLEFSDDGKKNITVWQGAALSCLAGLIFLIRWQEGVIVGVIAVHIVWRTFFGTDTIPFKVRIRQLCLLALIMLSVYCLVISPQCASWKILFGSYFKVPQGQNFLLYSSPVLWKPLFSRINGLVPWHPFMLVGLIGLIFLGRRAPWLTVAAVLYLCAQVYVNSIIIDDRFVTCGFGNRRFITSVPFLAAGTCAVMLIFNKVIRVAGTICACLFFPVWNLLIMTMYYRGTLSRYEGISLRQIFWYRSDWLEGFKTLLGQNYLYHLFANPANWTGKAAALFSLCAMLGLLVFLVFLVYYLNGIRTCPGPQHRYNGLIRLLTVGIIVLSVGLTVLLTISGMSARSVKIVHLGHDAFGQVYTLTLYDPHDFMGSLTPIHLHPGQEQKISLSPSIRPKRIHLVATLSSQNCQYPPPTQAVIKITVNSGHELRQAWFIQTPAQIDCMDRCDYPRPDQTLPPISSSWFDPAYQKRPHHWYRCSQELALTQSIDSLIIANLSTEYECHITGIACEE
ncbi:hypothetical protein JXQ70_20510 [bacterium]|nr:hypothetical protein [bacterium]